MYHFEYVTKAEAAPVKKELIAIINAVQDLLRDHFTFRFDFIGSSARNMITQDIKSNIGFDFDVNIEVNFIDREYSPREIREKLKVAPDATLAPAGALYMSTAFSTLKLDRKTEAQDVLRLAGAEMKRSGILLDRDEVLAAVSRSHDKKLLAGITVKDDGVSGNALITEQGLTSLEEELHETIRNIALEMKSGSALTCDPSLEDAPCTYCKMRMICRADATDGSVQEF